ncbi:uncharacterized protein LOC135827476 isoform X2 [Sycon ciliatum]|uniref:uncharacterized protein LOC135827476 isoform X2 n=1 Tax=Sycon ciliatum TaxID=27933 RepID=UPI0031F6A070
MKTAIVLCLCVALAAQADLSPNVHSLDASPECAGEVRLSFEHAKSKRGDTQHAVKRDASSPVIGVSFKPKDAAEDDPEMHKEFSGSSSGSSSLSLLIKGLAPGKTYQFRLRHGQRSDDATEWGEFSSSVESSSGTVNAESGPAGVGEASRNFCQSRRRATKVPSRPKSSSRVHRSTFASSSRRRRTYTYIYYDYGYYTYYYTYYYYSGTSLGGAIAGGVIGFIFIVSAIVVCCKFYLYGGCGRQPYRTTYGGRVMTSTIVTTPQVGAAGTVYAGQPQQVAMTAQPVPGAYTAQPVVGQPGAPQATMESKPAYPHAPAAATVYPNAPVAAANPAYPHAPQAQAQPWGGVAAPPQAAAPYPTNVNAPPPYSSAAQM